MWCGQQARASALTLPGMIEWHTCAQRGNREAGGIGRWHDHLAYAHATEALSEAGGHAAPRRALRSDALARVRARHLLNSLATRRCTLLRQCGAATGVGDERGYAAMLRVSENRRFLVHDDGRPFFYLGDTAWAVIQRLDRDETDEYLCDRAAKGFTVIQTVIVSEFEGLTAPNPAGEVPFIDGDPTRPNEAFFRDVDYLVERAGALGMYVGLLPTWGDKVGPVGWGTGPEVFTPANAEVYGEWLGRRYRDAPIIWIVGGDRDPIEARHFATWRALATGLDRGDGGRHLLTFHPQGRASSSRSFHGDEWLDFNMNQTGHQLQGLAGYRQIEHDYCLAPTRPTLDGEPCYEDHPVVGGEGYFSDIEPRRAAYWALFAGAWATPTGRTASSRRGDRAWRIASGCAAPGGRPSPSPARRSYATRAPSSNRARSSTASPIRRCSSAGPGSGRSIAVPPAPATGATP